MKLIAASATAAALAVGFVIVRPPALAPARQVEGATAACRDGSMSFSMHRPGTCSHHGPVTAKLCVLAIWLDGSCPRGVSG